MFTFAVGYLVVLLALVLYVARIGATQRRLSRELESLRGDLETRRDAGQLTSRAA